jgi:hypothetical protein
MFFSLGGAVVLAALLAVGLRHADHGGKDVPQPASPQAAFSAPATARPHDPPRTFHEMERPHPLSLLTPDPVPPLAP